MNGADKNLPPGDMVMRDAQGVCCSILYGQDDRSAISAATTRALYVAYAPPGVGSKRFAGSSRPSSSSSRALRPASSSNSSACCVPLEGRGN
jgi:DNA/RNA-binding domain of Phe-tRNA-synthetase-like protein